MDFKQGGVGKATINITFRFMKDLAYGITVIEYLICDKEVSL
jgi:hypothetical protein